MLAAMASGAPGFMKLSQSTQTSAARGAGVPLPNTEWSWRGANFLTNFTHRRTVLQQRAAGFGKDELPGVPEVRSARGHRDFVLNGLTRQQLGFESGLQHARWSWPSPFRPE